LVDFSVFDPGWSPGIRGSPRLIDGILSGLGSGDREVESVIGRHSYCDGRQRLRVGLKNGNQRKRGQIIALTEGSPFLATPLLGYTAEFHGGSKACRSYRPCVFFGGGLPGPPLVGLAPTQAVTFRAFSPVTGRLPQAESPKYDSPGCSPGYRFPIILCRPVREASAQLHKDKSRPINARIV
jgi:hypothetical protein